MAEWLAAVSVIVALATWSFSQHQQRRSRRAAHTADFLACLLTNETLSEASYRMARLIEAGERLDPATLDQETGKYILHLLNYYQYLATFYYEGVLDRNLVRTVRASTMKRAFLICEDVIADLRNRVSDTLFDTYERFVREF